MLKLFQLLLLEIGQLPQILIALLQLVLEAVPSFDKLLFVHTLGPLVDLRHLLLPLKVVS